MCVKGKGTTIYAILASNFGTTVRVSKCSVLRRFGQTRILTQPLSFAIILQEMVAIKKI